MYSVFNLINLYPLIMNLMPATPFKQVETRPARAWENCGMLKNRMLGAIHR